jgi:nitroreductase
MTRRFDPRPIPDELLLELLDLARRAPSAGYSQGVHFLALSGDALRRFWHTTGGDEWYADGTNSILDAPVVVLPLADPVAYTSRYSEDDKIEHGLHLAENWSVPFWLTDAAMATMALLLLIEEGGWQATLWGNFRNDDAVLEWANINDEELVATVLLGRADGHDVASTSLSRSVLSRTDRVRRVESRPSF